MYNIEEIKNKIIQGDSLEVMKEIPDNSIDTIITDPPYGLSFMGKEWDSFRATKNTKSQIVNWLGSGMKHNSEEMICYQEWTRQWAKEALRIAKPGATLLCFGGTRTWHRLACGLEDAGWIIKDTLMWLYGSGFPKATDISKQIDKREGRKGEIIGKSGGKGFSSQQIKNKMDGFRPYEKGLPFEYADRNIYAPATPESKLWNGWKSHGLKPAYEPIIMAMKPNEGSYVENALKWGVAGLNIDGGRIEFQNEADYKESVTKNQHADFNSNNGIRVPTKGIYHGDFRPPENYNPEKGRFPSNIILDEEAAEMLDKQSGISKSQGGRIGNKGSLLNMCGTKHQKGNPGFNDIGGASRFFYVAKASKSERNIGGIINNHPTVKPLKLMEYLCILTKTPISGIVLDPFAGSGTTCMAAKKTGRDYIGIEKEPDYITIAEKRINSIPKTLF